MPEEAILTIEGAGDNMPASAERGPGPRARSQAAQLEQAKQAAAGVANSTAALWSGHNTAVAAYIAADADRPTLVAAIAEWAVRLLKCKPRPLGIEFAAAWQAVGAGSKRGAESEVKPYKQLASRMLALARWSDAELTSAKDTDRLNKAGGVEINGAKYTSPLDALRKSGASVAAVELAWRAVARPPKPRRYRKSVEDALRDMFPKLAVQHRSGSKVESVKIAGHRGLLVLLVELSIAAIAKIDIATPTETSEPPEAA